MTAMTYFLVERSGDTTKVQEFPDEEYRAALDAYQKREQEMFPWPDDAPRVCLFRSDSLNTLRYTHASWFGSTLIVDSRKVPA